MNINGELLRILNKAFITVIMNIDKVGVCEMKISLILKFTFSCCKLRDIVIGV